MEEQKYEDLTPEQKKEIKDILFKGHLSMIWSMIKFSMGLFVSNSICVLVAVFYLVDCQLEIKSGFNFACMIVNFIFMFKYLDRQIKSNHDKVKTRVEEVLKNKAE